MAKYHLSNKAVVDLSDIWDYTCKNWSENQADKYYQLIMDCFNEILTNPKTGKLYIEIIENLKGYKVGKHIVFYRVVENFDIEIIRILHERMDIKSRLTEK